MPGGKERSDSILNALEGPVTRVNPAGRVLEVMGQKVRPAPGIDLSRIAPGSSVRVSGLRDADGVVRATRVQPAPGLRGASAIGIVTGVLTGMVPRRRGPRCPGGMALVDGAYCIDLFEGSLVEVLGRARTAPWSPFTAPDTRRRYKAVSRRGVTPQGYISQVQARAACAAAGRRLCTESEWERACKGPSPTQWPYGPARVPGRCNDDGVNPVPRLFRGGDVFHDGPMNDPRLNTLPRSLARTGAHPRCRGRYGVFDMVGNLHEWVEATRGGRGVFRGGFYADVLVNGHGCDYATRAHSPGYHDYSTGFRCCANAR